MAENKTEQQLIELAADFKDRYGKMKNELITYKKYLLQIYGVVRALDDKFEEFVEMTDADGCEAVQVYITDLRGVCSSIIEEMLGIESD